jgi:hypothetical protein
MTGATDIPRNGVRCMHGVSNLPCQVILEVLSIDISAPFAIFKCERRGDEVWFVNVY